MYTNNRQSDTRSTPVSARVIPVPERKAFFAALSRALKQQVPAELGTVRSRGDFNLMKVWFEHYRVHYEVVIDQQIGKIEIGLHFEDGPGSSLIFLTALDARILEIKDLLGPQVELERWTQSWARIYELHPLVDLDAKVTRLMAERLVTFVTVLQPIVNGVEVRLDRPGI